MRIHHFIEFPAEASSKILKNGQFSFENIMPTPKELSISAGENTKAAIAWFLSDKCRTYRIPLKYRRAVRKVYLYKGEYEETVEALAKELAEGRISKDEAIRIWNNEQMLIEFAPLYEVGRQLSENARKFGAPDAVAWHKKNWGAYSILSCCTEPEIGLISFETADFVPEGIFKKICKLCPKSKINYSSYIQDNVYFAFNRNGRYERIINI